MRSARGTYKERVAEHGAKRLGDLTKDPRAGDYTEVSDDEDWLLKDESGMGWGGDDSHNDMLSFCPSDAGLIEWRCGPTRKSWLDRADTYIEEGGPDDVYGNLIRKRVAELDARFATFGKKP